MAHFQAGRLTCALLSLFFCSLLAAPVLAGAAEDVVPGSSPAASAPANPSGAERVISAREALSLASSLLAQNRAEDAEKIYAVLRNNPSQDIRTEAVFQLAHIRLRQGRTRQAISLFHEILNSRPELARVRLDLAHAYFLDKNYADSAFQFELVKGGDLPPEVLAKVDMFLDAIRRQKNWTVDFSVSPVTDSNINQVSGDRLECIDIGLGAPLCRRLEEKASGAGLSGNAMVDYFWRFHQDWGLRSSVGFYGTTYEENDYNDYIFYAALGPRYLWDRGEVSLQPTFRKRWIGDRQYNEDYGLRLDARQIYGRLLLNTGASMSSSSYDDDYVHSVLKGHTWNAYLRPRYILTDRTFVQAGLDFFREDTNMDSYANDNWRYALGAYHIFPYGISLFVEGSLTRTSYQAAQWFVTKDNRFDRTTRIDHTYGLTTSLSSNILERYGLTPVLQYTYTRRDSNIWTRDYDRSRLSMYFNYRF